MKIYESLTAAVMPPLMLTLAILFTAGCDNKEKVLDIETPRGQVEVERDRDTGAVDVTADDDDKLIDIDTPGADVEIGRDRDAGDVDVDVAE